MAHQIERWIAAGCAALLGACGGGGGDASGVGAGGNAAALQAEIDRLFPYMANQPLNVLFQCGRANSRLTYYFGFSPNGTLDVFFETDTQQQVSFRGTYTHANGAIRMLALNNNILPLDETTTRLVPHLGIVGELYTANMACGAVAHGYNDPAVDNFKSYRCPAINVGPAGYDENFFEFADSSSPFNIVFRGGIFRHREVSVQGNPNPIVHRAVGIFRRTGDTFYADFGSQFSDHNLLKGSFLSNEQQLLVEQLEPQAGPCSRR
jgi:hypothetical protein